MTPDLATCRELAAAGYTMLPVYRRLICDDLTPVSLLARLREEEYSFLFESVVGGERLARYSFLGFDPVERITVCDGRSVLHTATGDRELPGDPFTALRAYLAPFRSPDLPGLPRFCGGLVGYFSYDSVRFIEHLPVVPPDPLGLPDVHLLRCRYMLVFDHSYNHLLIITHLDLRDGADVEAAWRAAASGLDTVEERIRRPRTPDLVLPVAQPTVEYRRHSTRAEYEEAVRRIQAYIRAGDIFQAVPSQRLSSPLMVEPFQVYRSIRSLNPSPYMFCLRLGEASLVGASPEILVRVEDRRVAVRPIAGTAPRGADAAEDERLGRELLADPKERAEHTMLIDLGRNDVGRVCRGGSVRLLEEMIIERYSHVQHIVSHVEGELREDCDAIDALRSCHPAGTVSGAPKIRAMEIIDELEPVKRGPYAGAVGYLDFRGNLDTCIALRTAVLAGGEAHVQAGAGIVADSVPAKEYEETLHKAKAMLQAIARADDF